MLLPEGNLSTAGMGGGYRTPYSGLYAAEGAFPEVGMGCAGRLAALTFGMTLPYQLRSRWTRSLVWWVAKGLGLQAIT